MKTRISHFAINVGFTLVEMAVVLMIVALILGGLFVPISEQIDQRNRAETEKRLEEIKESLIGYALSHGYFPCPAKSAVDGAEDRDGTTCKDGKRVGHLPWTELGVTNLDGWDREFRYSVVLAYANSGAKISLSPLTARDITIRTRDKDGNIVNVSNLNDIPVVVTSMGRNGFWGYDVNGVQLTDTSETNIDEDANGNGDGTIFWSRITALNTAITGGEFDDLVVWISPNVYINRMVSAGQLP
jgi:type II secretory pathway pseudopilin PulG